jgi:hypothetical protein
MALTWDFLSDLELPDGTLLEIDADKTFVKRWSIRNVGDEAWQNLKLVSHLNTSSSVFQELSFDVPDTAVGEIAIVSVKLDKPLVPGEFTWYFQIKNANGKLVPSHTGYEFMYTMLRFVEAGAIPRSWRDHPRLLELEKYGVTLSDDHPTGGDWKDLEIELVWELISSAGKTALASFQNCYEVDEPNEKLAFQAIYGPQLIFRSRNDSAHSKFNWYARKPDGFTMVLANNAFFPGTQQTGIHKHLHSSLRFNSTQLVAHELGHALTWQYNNIKPGVDVSTHYINAFEKKDGLKRDEGLTFGARSSFVDDNGVRHDFPSEITADALANLLMDALATDASGIKREEHLQELFCTLIEHRRTVYNSNKVRSRINNVSETANAPSILLSLVNFDEIQDWLDALRPKP